MIEINSLFLELNKKSKNYLKGFVTKNEISEKNVFITPEILHLTVNKKQRFT